MLVIAPSVAIIVAVATSSIIDPVLSGIVSVSTGLIIGIIIYCSIIRKFKI